MADTVTHFEIYAEDPANLVEFYRALFSWTIDKAPGIDYWQIQTGGGGQGIRGGLTHRPIEGPRSWVHYVTVEALDEAVTQVEGLGGTVVRTKAAVPKNGWYAVMADPEGNIFALWQHDRNAMPPLDPEE
ncbi:VOC family protein [Kribbella sp. CA-247076]|uniref:VOC family protein n=1 Tax=Kribbella sp. CA-247076 TaxID=3239941 RepID=UPI003D9335B1